MLFRVLCSKVCLLGNSLILYEESFSKVINHMSILFFVIEFIELTITCNLPNTDGLLSDCVIDLQLHKHTYTCIRGSHSTL